jgi:hypothetical protein
MTLSSVCVSARYIRKWGVVGDMRGIVPLNGNPQEQVEAIHVCRYCDVVLSRC